MSTPVQHPTSTDGFTITREGLPAISSSREEHRGQENIFAAASPSWAPNGRAGGDFWSGAVGALAGGGGGPATSATDLVLKTLVAAAVGGTAAEIGGGDFANGAISAAYTFLFNEAALQWKELPVSDADAAKLIAAAKDAAISTYNAKPDQYGNKPEFGANVYLGADGTMIIDPLTQGSPSYYDPTTKSTVRGSWDNIQRPTAGRSMFGTIHSHPLSRGTYPTEIARFARGYAQLPQIKGRYHLVSVYLSGLQGQTGSRGPRVAIDFVDGKTRQVLQKQFPLSP